MAEAEELRLSVLPLPRYLIQRSKLRSGGRKVRDLSKKEVLLRRRLRAEVLRRRRRLRA